MREKAFDPTIEAEANNQEVQKAEFTRRERLQAAVLAGLAKHGAFTETSGWRVFDVEKLRNWSSRDEIYAGHHKISQLDMASALSRTSGVAKTEQGYSEAEDRPVMVTPKSVEDLLATGEEAYGERSKTALLQPWELGQKHQSWGGAFNLDSGEQTNMAEMAVVATLSKWQADRGNDGRLIITHPASSERVPFSASMLKEFAGINPIITIDKRKISWDSNPLEFATKYLTHLIESGILRQSDFRTVGGSRTAQEFNVHERKLNPKAPYLTYTNGSGQSAKYYIGREKLVGTDMSIDSAAMSAVQLDTNTVGIVIENSGKKEIIRTFSLLDSNRMAELQNSAKQRLKERGLPSTRKHLSMNTTVGEKIMKGLMQEYSVMNFLPKRPGEKDGDYKQRTAKLGDAHFVLSETANFFQKTGIGFHNLPWQEQLLLSRALLEERDKSRLALFAKKFGIKGVRTFLSLDYDETLGEKILEIGEKLHPKLAAEVFKKYGDIVDSANQAEEYLGARLFVGSAQKQDIAAKIKDQLLRKGKDLLSQIAHRLNQQESELEAVSLVKELEAIKADVLLFAATFKNMPGEASIKLEEMQGINLEAKDSKQLTEFEKQQMREIFTANRVASYPEKLNQLATESFEKTLDEGGNKFNILDYQGRIVAYFHSRAESADTVYIGSLNLHPSAKDSPIATAMIKGSIENVSDKNLTAVVWSQNKLLSRFYGTLGFKPSGKIKNYLGSGEEYTKLDRPKKSGQLESELPKAA